MSPESTSLIEQYTASGLLQDESPDNIRRWLSESCYAGYQPRIMELLSGSEDDVRRLNDMFWTTIPFGTGGRRGAMGQMGPATINERTIAESAYGLASYMQQQTGNDGGVAVVAHDTRNRSQEFARITATTFAALGLKVYVFGPHRRTVDLVGEEKAAELTHRSTPLLSFAVRQLKCDIGVMISASHNPPADNGFKAYWSSGAQVTAPHDKGVIECVNAARDIGTVDYDEAVANGSIVVVGDEIDDAFAEAVLATGLSERRDIKAVFSPLHGVGETAAFDAIARAGFDGVRVFEHHRLPSGDFPNVADHFPNPERTQVFDCIIEAEKDTDCEVILATDPDADRVAIAVRDDDGKFVILTGNQTGALLCDYVCQQRKANGSLTADSYVVETLVTSPMTGTIAKSYGADAIMDLLVGFKFIAKAIDERGPENFIFATEESIGYLAGQYARDKDASIGCLYILEMAAELKAEGKTILQRLDELYAQHGVHCESQKSIYCEGSSGLQQIKELMKTIRTTPPATLAGLQIAQVRDFETLEIKSPTGEAIGKFERPQGNLVFLDSAEGDATISIAVRPSGTEPKIKFYFFVQESMTAHADLQAAKKAAAARVQEADSELEAWADSVLQAG
ncbi:MAG: phospho-sugar mutase [Planctomycetaceae bacterium]